MLIAGVVVSAAAVASLGAGHAGASPPGGGEQPIGVPQSGPWFQRAATMPVHLNTSAEEETAAEIAAVTQDGRSVLYTDSPGERVGFAGLGRRGELTPKGTVELAGEPTSVAVLGDELALVAVNTSASYTEPSGELSVVDIADREIVATHQLGGQPDSIALSGDGRYAAIAIENERDEDLGDGGLPQTPAGFLSIVDIEGAPTAWTTREVDLTGIAEVAPEDPEPEYVAINGRNQAAVTLQENNHIAVIDLPSGDVRNHFSAGEATVEGVDTEKNGRIETDGTVSGPREPDSVAWLDDTTLGTADEGDWHGGTRTWTAFDAASGEVAYSSGNELEHLAVSLGQYPEDRAGKKGVEPEAIAVATYGKHRYAFVGLERANLVAVYNIDEPRNPKLVQGLPTGVAPEGLLPVPRRGMFVVAAEEDSAEDGVRASLTSYRLTHASHGNQLRKNAAAPSIVSTADESGAPIGFGALSGLSGIPGDRDRVVAVHDNAYVPSRILTINAARANAPATVERELTVTRDGAPASYDLEGIAATGDGYWLAAEGNPANDAPNLLIRTDQDGAVTDEIALPDEVAAGAERFGFEGVAAAADASGTERVWVAVQREWADNKPGQTTLARYTPGTDTWDFAAYPLERAPEGGWVGLSELTATPDGGLLVLERDNQRGTAAKVKRVYRVDIARTQPVPAGTPKPVVHKKLLLDLLPALRAGGGEVPDKPEGLALLDGPGRGGKLVAAIDNDGLDDAPGESVFLRLGRH